MAGKGSKKRNNGIPVTAILAVTVAVLMICAVLLGVSVFHRGQLEEQSQEKSQKETLQTGKLEQDTERESESETSIETSIAEPESESESEESAAKPESDAESEVILEVPESKPETEQADRLVVAIDPGHQGSWVDMSDTEPNGPGSSEMKAKATTGTQGSFSGKTEYELNLEISLLLREELEARGYEVILTREDNDTAISNADRAQMAYEQGGDIYVRIHANGSDDSSVSGALAMVPSSANSYVGYLAEDSYLLADCILSDYCERAGFSSLGIQYYDNMTGINWSQIPVMILEMGFMTNQSDDLRMADSAVQPLMVEGIADGIDRYFTEKGMKQQEVSAEAAAQMDELLERIEEEQTGPAQEQGENWAVSVSSLNTGASGSLNGDVSMKSASVIKVFIMAAVYDRVCYPSSEDRYISFEESYEGELRDLITAMITVSDNDAANEILTRLGHGDAQAGLDAVNQFCEENGYTATVLGRKFLEEDPVGDNYTSAEDCCRLLAGIYNGTCVNAEASAKMLDYLKNQTRTGKIPAGLSGTTAVTANKTGELYGEYGDYVENDIAIVEDGDLAYVLCVLSGSLNDNGSAVTRISDISKTVYETLRESD